MPQLGGCPVEPPPRTHQKTDTPCISTQDMLINLPRNLNLNTKPRITNLLPPAQVLTRRLGGMAPHPQHQPQPQHCSGRGLRRAALKRWPRDASSVRLGRG